MNFNLPNILTWLRIVSIPLLIMVFYTPLGLQEKEINYLATFIFVTAAVTDWIDGWLARKWNQTSPFGAFLDPVADKLMVCAALVALVDLERVSPIIGIIIIGREITISALREWMMQVGSKHGLKVNWLGKAKTVGQMVAIPCLIFDGILFFDFLNTREIGEWLIFLAAFLTVISMINYLYVATIELREKF